MPRLRVLSGSDVVGTFKHFGFAVASQKGSHVKLKRTLENGVSQILTIPLHKELDKGTLRAIVRQSSRYILEEELAPHFYEQ